MLLHPFRLFIFSQSSCAVRFLCFLVLLSPFDVAQALEVGDQLPELAFITKPVDFVYRPNGLFQVVTVYPAKPASRDNGKLNQLLQSKGVCPLAVTDIHNKAWFAPVSLVEKEMAKRFHSSEHNPDCPLSGDYEGLVARHWGLKPYATTIVVNGQGEVIFLKYGLLSKKEENTVLELLGLKQRDLKQKD